MLMYVGADQAKIEKAKETLMINGNDDRGPIICTSAENAIPFANGKLIVLDLPETILDNATPIGENTYRLNDEFGKPVKFLFIQKMDVLSVN